MQPSNVYYGSGVQPTVGGNKSSSRRRLLIIIGVVLLVATIALGVLSAIGNSSAGTGESKKILNLIASGDGVKSYDLLSTEGKASIAREEWVIQVLAMKPLLADKKLEKAYSQELEPGIIETAYNVGEKGSVYRIVVVHEASTGLIETVRYNKTSL